jgi:conjugative relaxase-like TrwC/TraI family protein
MAAGQHEYYTGLAGAEDYYLTGKEAPGQWWGQGAEALGLTGTVGADDLKRLFEGFGPDGKKLVQNAGKENRVPGVDCVFTPPKSGVAFATQADPVFRLAFERCHDASVEAALSILQERWSFCRTGKDGQTREQAKLVVALFKHWTNRNQDPNLHTHCLLLNVGVTPDGQTRALDREEPFKVKMAFGAIFRCQLSYELENRLGLETHRVKNWFEVSGVPKDLRDKFSSRREEILDYLKDLGLDGAKAASVATLVTRSTKENLPRAELFAKWRAIGEQYGFSTEEAHRLIRTFVPPRDLATEFKEAFGAALERLSSQHSHFSYLEVVRAVAEESQCRGLSAQEVMTRLDQELEVSQDIVRLGLHDGELHFTTRKMFELEARLLSALERSKDENSQIVSRGTAAAVLRERPTMTDEQMVAVLHVSREAGSIKCVTGMAGTGKSFMLDAAREVWEGEGLTVLGAAVAGSTAQRLKDDSGIRSRTLLSLLKSLEHGKQKLSARHVVVVDEAGTVPTWMMESLVTKVTDAGAKLVCVGDAGQLQPIEAGGPFRAMCERLGAAKLTKIIRQQDQWARDAVTDFASGDAKTGLARYAERGLVHVADDRHEAIRAVAQAYAEDGLDASRVQEKFILAGTNKEVSILNSLVQAQRLKAGELGLGIAVGESMLRINDRVLFTKRDRVLGFENGWFGTLANFSTEDRTLTVRLDSGQFVIVPLDHYQSIRLSYATTKFKGQGATVDQAFILTGGHMTDREASYVEASRARTRTTFFCDRQQAGDELEQLAKQMSRSRAKGLAHDLLRGPELELTPHV